MGNKYLKIFLHIIKKEKKFSLHTLLFSLYTKIYSQKISYIYFFC